MRVKVNVDAFGDYSIEPTNNIVAEAIGRYMRTFGVNTPALDIERKHAAAVFYILFDQQTAAAIANNEISYADADANNFLTLMDYHAESISEEVNALLAHYKFDVYDFVVTDNGFPGYSRHGIVTKVLPDFNNEPVYAVEIAGSEVWFIESELTLE